MRLCWSLIPTFTLLLCSCTAEKKVGYPIEPVPFTQVKVGEGFWGQRLQASREVTIPLAFSKCEESGRYDNFVKAARQMRSDVNLGYEAGGFSFDDTDVYKTIEGASYLLQTRPDARLEAYIDSVLTIVASAQEPDGYLYTARTMNPEHPHPWAGDRRWSQEEVLSHELYNLGHMVEGAVAHWQATGKRNFLDIATRYADCVVREVGPGDGQACVVPGHQIAEMALCRLYLATGEKKYLDQARFFLDYRGKTTVRETYSQSHLPVLEQEEAVGHAVRAAYMYAGMADVAALTGDPSYARAIDRIWENITSKKLYITGGIGATSEGEAFGADYYLPNATSYCETCAAIGNVYVNHRMFLLHGDSKYYDVLERTLYNGLISGVSLDGGAFFYPNPLESDGSHQRQPWFGCACCPSNISRFIPSVPGYVYASRKDSLWVNLYMPGSLDTRLDGKEFHLSQETAYPWSGDILLTVGETRHRKALTLKLRIPGWVRGEVAPGGLYSYADGKKLDFTIQVNGKPAEGTLQDGYFCIRRSWKKGDRIQLHFDREPRLVKASGQVEADKGRLAVEMGPLVYCAEAVDNGGSVRDAVCTPGLPLTVSHDPDLSGIERIHMGELSLIPYYAWNHRGPGEMIVWMKTN